MKKYNTGSLTEQRKQQPLSSPDEQTNNTMMSATLWDNMHKESQIIITTETYNEQWMHILYNELFM